MNKDDAGYERHKENARIRQAEISRASRDIGSRLKPVKNPKRRESCRYDFRLFCETYFPAAFKHPWSDDHLRVIKGIQRAVLHSDLQAIGMPRGSGKTTLCERAVLWAVLYGHHKFVFLVAATEDNAKTNLSKMRVELETNKLLFEDFPGACLPIRALNGVNNRQRGQLMNGEPTRLECSDKEIVFATIPDDPVSSARVRVVGITGAMRGAAVVDPITQAVHRPSLCLIDDPQTRESARSVPQNKTRTDIIMADIMEMSGPDQSMSALMACTVIQKGDMCDKALDRDIMPHWRGVRCKFLYEWPNEKAMALWHKYGEILRESLRFAEEDDPEAWSDATAFYKKNRKKMDRGAVVAWEHRFDPKRGEISAVQKAMNVWLRTPSVFASEYQNEPIEEATEDLGFLTIEEIVLKHAPSKFVRNGVVFQEAEIIVASIDISLRVLWFQVMAFAPNFTGQVLDYGTWPDQRIEYFAKRNVRKTLGRKYPGTGEMGAIYAGLEDLIGKLSKKVWKREDGLKLSLKQGIVDANYGESRDTVYQAVRESDHAALWLPSHGVGISENDTAIHDYKKSKTNRSDRRGPNWVIHVTKSGAKQRYVRLDSNFWKTFAHRRLATPRGTIGSVDLFHPGKDRKGTPRRAESVHQMFAEHHHAENYELKKGKKFERVIFEEKPAKDDNDYLDTNAYCHVAGSIAGCALPEALNTGDKNPSNQKKLKLSEIQKRKAA